VQIEFCSRPGVHTGGTYDAARTRSAWWCSTTEGALNFIGIITYKNGTVVRYPGTLDNVTAGK